MTRPCRVRRRGKSELARRNMVSDCRSIANAKPQASNFSNISCMRFLPFARLLRLPNVFTAFADILLGTIAAATWRENPFGAALLLLASGSLYCAGMVWNDYFDFEEDKRERPFRPIPAGQIARNTAF